MMLGGAPNKGEGIFKALEIGAAADGLGMLMVAGPFGIGPRVLTIGTEPDTVRLQMIFITGEPTAIWLNKQGKRFIDETVTLIITKASTPSSGRPAARATPFSMRRT